MRRLGRRFKKANRCCISILQGEADAEDMPKRRNCAEVRFPLATLLLNLLDASYDITCPSLEGCPSQPVFHLAAPVFRPALGFNRDAQDIQDKKRLHLVGAGRDIRYLKSAVMLGYWIFRVGYWILNFRFPLLDIGYSVLDIGY